jgi:predicted NAD/FAD-binding protein
MHAETRLKIAVVGTGISGLSAAWLLSKDHDVTVYERADRAGGHSNTIMVPVGGGEIPVDTGFIVFNPRTYPNLTALFKFLEVQTHESDMSFGVSLDEGALEYCGRGLRGLFGQKRNVVSRRFWSMLTDLVRFYRNAPSDVLGSDGNRLTLGEYLDRHHYGSAFRDDHLLPMAAAIWSSAPAEILAYPAKAFIQFFENHGLLQLSRRPKWETVTGGSRSYVSRLTAPLADRIKLDAGIREVRRLDRQVLLTDTKGRADCFDHVILATHADQALAVLADASAQEQSVLGAFRYSRNLAVLHTDEGLMPRRRSVWSSWNYTGSRQGDSRNVSVTYWMNRLQTIASPQPIFLTLNPPRPPRAGTLLHSEIYEHPVFDAKAMAAQRRLWPLQGQRRTWFCGAYFGSGFHEDGLQAGLAVAEQVGGVRRPWRVPNESGRIVLSASLKERNSPELLP